MRAFASRVRGMLVPLLFNSVCRKQATELAADVAVAKDVAVATPVTRIFMPHRAHVSFNASTVRVPKHLSVAHREYFFVPTREAAAGLQRHSEQF
jgi:hypothetical protein